MGLFNLFNKKSVRYERLAMFSPGLSHRIERTNPWYIAKRKFTDIEVVRVTTPTESKLVIMPKYPVDKAYKELFEEDLALFIKAKFGDNIPQSLDLIEKCYKNKSSVPACLIRY